MTTTVTQSLADLAKQADVAIDLLRSFAERIPAAEEHDGECYYHLRAALSHTEAAVTLLSWVRSSLNCAHAAQQLAKPEVIPPAISTVPCDGCSGSGFVTVMGSDNMDLDKDCCNQCGGAGTVEKECPW